MRSLLVVALTSSLIPDVQTIPAKSWRQLEGAMDGGADAILEQARSLDDEKLLEIVRTRLALIDEYSALLDSLTEDGIVIAAKGDDNYPCRVFERLAAKAPPFLFVAGNSALLQSESIGIVGSREVDDQGAEFASELSREAVSRGKAVVSGGARGVDQIAMTAAIHANGNVVGFMADSMARAMRSQGLREALEDQAACLASPFSPSAGFNVGNAMSRNKLIYAHSLATVVIASAEGEGGTWAGAVEAIQLELHPVLVRDVDLPGNVALLRRGAIALRNPTDLWQAIDSYQPLQGTLL